MTSNIENQNISFNAPLAKKVEEYLKLSSWNAGSDEIGISAIHHDLGTAKVETTDSGIKISFYGNDSDTTAEHIMDRLLASSLGEDMEKQDFISIKNHYDSKNPTTHLNIDTTNPKNYAALDKGLDILINDIKYDNASKDHATWEEKEQKKQSAKSTLIGNNNNYVEFAMAYLDAKVSAAMGNSEQHSIVYNKDGQEHNSSFSVLLANNEKITNEVATTLSKVFGDIEVHLQEENGVKMHEIRINKNAIKICHDIVKEDKNFTKKMPNGFGSIERTMGRSH